MHKWLAKHIRELNKDGITFIPNAVSKKKCNYYISRFENIITKFEKNRIPLNTTCQTIENCFRHDVKLINLIYHRKVDTILKKLIDENYILIASNLLNRTYRSFQYTRPERLGKVWHHDSRVVGNKTLKGFGYIAITMFNDFSEKNASTLYVPKSHMRRNQPIRKFNYKYKQILGKAGTIAIIDAGLWHKTGKVSSTTNRWGLYSNYGPWYVKPYYRYPDMLGNHFPKLLGNKVNNNTKENVLRLLHYYSTPPKNELERRYTLTKDHKVNGILKSYKY